MAQAFSDRQLVRTLRPFVRATGPVLAALSEANLLGLRDRPLRRVIGLPKRKRDWFLDRAARLRMPGTARWAAMPPAERTKWWLNRVGRLTALLASVPGLGGALAERLPVQDALGAAGEGLLLCAIAGEYGVTDDAERVQLLAWILFRRRITLEVAADLSAPEAGADAVAGLDADEDRRTAELTAELAESQRKHGSASLKAIATTVWRLGRLLWGVQSELGNRPKGRFYHRLFGLLPVVGMAADYLGERSALRRVRRRGVRWLTTSRELASQAPSGR